MFVAEDFLARRSGDNGGLRTVNQRFGFRDRAPGLVSGNDGKVIDQGGAGAAVADLRLGLFAVQFTLHHLPENVQVFARMG